MDTIETIEQIESDFAAGEPPFDNIEFPEERLLEEVKNQKTDTDVTVYLNKEERLQLLSSFSMLDYNRDANQLVDNLLELHAWEPRLFDPWYIQGSGQMEYYFEEIGFRYPNRDAKAWAKNSRILREKYSGKWSELLLETGCDAKKLVEQLDEDGFNVLKGVKVSPMFARFVDEYVADLDNLWELDIPVDTHISKISQELFQEDLSDDEIRDRWYFYAIQNNIDRSVVDGALWQIGNNRDEWGADYLKELLDTDELEYL
jgi:hypothetical protein